MKYSVCALLCLGGLFHGSGVQADEPQDIDFSLESAYFSTIASGHLEAVRKAPGVVTVITADEIQAMGATHLDEVLQSVPGLHVFPSDLNRLDPVYSIRGIHSGFSPHVLVLFNGMEMKNAYNGGLASAFRMPLNGIERVEIIKGASSSLYGANAYSGVINIVPKKIRDYMPAIAQLRVGSFNSQDLTVQYRHENELGTGWFFSLERQSSVGDRSRIIDEDLQTSIDRQMGTNASLAPGPLNTDYALTNILLNVENDRWSWNNLIWYQDETGTGQGVSRALDNEGYVESQSLLSHLQYKSILDHEISVESNFSYHYQHAPNQLHLFPDNAVLPVGADGHPFTGAPAKPVTFIDGMIGVPLYTAHKLYADHSWQYVGLEDQIWRFQVGGQHTDLTTEEYKNYGLGVPAGDAPVVDGTLTSVEGTPYIFLDDEQRTNLFLAVQNQWSFAHDWTLTVGGRWDHYSDFGSIFNPRVGLVWETRPDLTTKLLYGEAFRAPSFSELYLRNNPSGIGSPDLKPETIKTYELVFDYRIASGLGLTTSIYHYDAMDLIENKLVGSTVKFQNAAQQEGYGLETEMRWESDHLTVQGYYSYQHSENSVTGEAIANVPNHTAYVALDYQLMNRWRVRFDNHWIGSRPRDSEDNREKLKGYSWSTLKLSRTFPDSDIKAALIFKNLFDADAYSPSTPVIPGDYPLEGRSVWGELTYTF